MYRWGLGPGVFVFVCVWCGVCGVVCVWLWLSVFSNTNGQNKTRILDTRTRRSCPCPYGHVVLSVFVWQYLKLLFPLHVPSKCTLTLLFLFWCVEEQWGLQIDMIGTNY